MLPPITEGPGAALPRYSVRELNEAIGGLLERGFAPRFLLDATVGRPQLKKGHLWLTLTDGEATISAVVWASQRARLSLQPEDGDGVVVVGRLNFWSARASLCVQILDLRPTLSAVLRRFEQVRTLLEPEGLFAPERRRPLVSHPRRLALLTSAPSSALADMLRTALERWPATALLVVPIPVQGGVQGTICRAVEALGRQASDLGLDGLVLARGGGSREDLAVFDDAQLARTLAACPIPVICGLGHEDDITIADLVADYRAATPTAAIVAALPDRQTAIHQLGQRRRQLRQVLRQRLLLQQQQLTRQRQRLEQLHPQRLLPMWRDRLDRQRRLLLALSPTHVMERGFAVVRDISGTVLRSIEQLEAGAVIQVQLRDGWFQARVDAAGCHTLAMDDTPGEGDGAAPQGR
ncbi:MAG: exodeoxyribonuclease VII large subunit [Cyanobacteriota bacterium]|nr:exodeoxyribonuclease VII large subunit [Cyanobacteriota bacterium]